MDRREDRHSSSSLEETEPCGDGGRPSSVGLLPPPIAVLRRRRTKTLGLPPSLLPGPAPPSASSHPLFQFSITAEQRSCVLVPYNWLRATHLQPSIPQGWGEILRVHNDTDSRKNLIDFVSFIECTSIKRWWSKFELGRYWLEQFYEVCSIFVVLQYLLYTSVHLQPSILQRCC